MPSTRQTVILKLDPTDAAIILKNDGTCEVSLPDVNQDPVPENIVMGAALAYALQDAQLCDLLHAHFQQKCAQMNEKCA